jgi:selenocysteine lyase/cysteine desulfurase
VLASSSEYQGNAFGLLQAWERGVVVDIVPDDASGMIDLDVLGSMIDERVKLVCLTQISMANGAVQPAAAVGRLCRDAGVPYLLDACQAAGQLPLDVDAIGCDFLCYTGRKWMRGPRGTGVLYARRSTVDALGPSPFVDGRSAEWLDRWDWQHTPGAQRFELGERSYAGQIGLAVATRYALDVGIESIAARISGLSGRLRAELSEIERVVVRDEGGDRSGIVTFTVDGRTALDVYADLADAGVFVGAPGRRNAQWDLGTRGIDAVVRVGVHYFNIDDELDRLVEAVSDIARA